MLVRDLARIAHDLGLAAWFGGASMGAVGMNAATREVDDHTQRLRVANAGWFRWAPVVAVAAGAHLIGAVSLSRMDRPGADPDQRLLIVRSAVTAGAILATLETGLSGQRVMAAGDVPVSTAVVPISDTPPQIARAQRRLRVAQWLVPGFTAAIGVLHAHHEEAGCRGPLLAWVT